MQSLSTVQAAFAALGPTPNISQLAAFYAQNFGAPGSDLVPTTPSDWTSTPGLLANIANPLLQQFASDINAVWPTLAFAVSPSVQANPAQHTLLYVPELMIVPGARFRESYYWDSYWILKGLQACGMLGTAEGILENFISLVSEFGFVPNGGRLYYTDRSQPPLLTQMVADHVAATQNTTFLAYAIALLDIEYDFWMSTSTVSVGPYTLNQYVSRSGMPRPEGYVEDVATASGLYTSNGRACLFSELASAAASGWDFSGRWLADGFSLQQACIRSLAPVDLNAIMYLNEVTLANMHTTLGQSQAAARYAAAAAARLQAIEALMWNEGAGVYVDYNVTASAQMPPTWYASTIVPLWARAFDTGNATRAQRIVDSLLASKALSLPGGIPTSTLYTGQQWDMPNAWAPLQHMAIVGLNALGTTQATTLAESLATLWVSSNLAAYNANGKQLFEKYDALNFGSIGGGGEYTVQTGFGWTNGVLLDLLRMYPNMTPITDPADLAAS